MAFAEDVKALSEWHLSGGDSLGEVPESALGIFIHRAID